MVTSGTTMHDHPGPVCDETKWQNKMTNKTGQRNTIKIHFLSMATVNFKALRWSFIEVELLMNRLTKPMNEVKQHSCVKSTANWMRVIQLSNWKSMSLRPSRVIQGKLSPWGMGKHYCKDYCLLLQGIPGCHPAHYCKDYQPACCCKEFKSGV